MINNSVSHPLFYSNEMLVNIGKSFPDGKCQEMLLVSKNFNEAANYVLTLGRIKFLEVLVQDLLKLKFEPTRIANCNELMIKVKAIDDGRLSCIRDAIVSLFKGISQTVWINQSNKHPFHVDKTLVLNLLRATTNGSKNTDNVSWFPTEKTSGSKELIFTYLEFMKNTLIEPTGLFLEVCYHPFDVFAKPIVGALSCSSLKKVNLHFKEFCSDALEQVLKAINENNNIHSVVFCNLTDDYDDEYNDNFTIEDFPPECLKLINQILGEQFKIEFKEYLKSPTLSLTKF